MKRFISFFALSLLIASTATAQATRPTLSVSLGFDGVFKPDNWSPVYVTLADADRRAGTLELRVAHARVGHDVVARVAANPDATTFTLYAPLGLLDAAQLQFRDSSGTLLARRDLGDAIAGTPSAFATTSVGVSGETAAARRVANALTRDTGESVAAGAIDARLLPERAIGYRAIDVLVIAGVDTDAIDDRVEQAILDWVRAGGVLIAWPGAQRATADSPLGVALPADIGDVGVRSIDGAEHVARALTRRAGDVADLSDGGVATFRRRIGLGQIVLTNVDPTTLGGTTADARLARWRALTENEFSLLPGDRRRGVFDPLVAQSLAEQTIREAAPPMSTSVRPWLWFALGVGLLLGPAEIAMLLVAGRHPRTLYTLAGLGTLVASGVALVVVHDRVAKPAAAEVIVDDAVRVGVTTGGPRGDDATTEWLGGDAADPRRQPAGASHVAQREDRFEVSPTWLADGASRPLTRSIEFHPTAAADASSSIVARVSPTDVALGEAAPIAADDPATVRVETGLERLAARPEWGALFMDRTLASRLVRLQETERATLAIAREGDADHVRFVVHVTRH